MASNSVQIYIYNINPTSVYGNIWHSSVVVFGKEYSFGQKVGQTCKNPGNPDEKFEVGLTLVNERQLRSFLEILKADFNDSTYHLGKKNCNVYSCKLCEFLCENPLIPDCLKAQKRLESAVTVAIETRSLLKPRGITGFFLNFLTRSSLRN